VPTGSVEAVSVVYVDALMDHLYLEHEVTKDHQRLRLQAVAVLDVLS
jgi:hypothetical protein